MITIIDSAQIDLLFTPLLDRTATIRTKLKGKDEKNNRSIKVAIFIVYLLLNSVWGY